MRCPFCFAENAAPRLTKEHLVSRPVATAFGIDRTAPFGRFGSGTATSVVTRLETLAVKFFCDACNNGWMNDLEHRMGAVASWMRDPSHELGDDAATTVRTWVFKTYLVLSAIEGGARSFGSSDDFHVVPAVKQARQVYERDFTNAFDDMAFGVARVTRPPTFDYAFGNPTVVPRGPRYLNARSVGAAVITLGNLQLWVAVPVLALPTTRIHMPKRVRGLSGSLRAEQLRTMRAPGDIADIVVDHGEHDAAQLLGY